MKNYPPEFKADAVALYESRPDATIRSVAAVLDAAGIELDRAPEEMGGMPKGAGRSGASDPMMVNETVIALIRPKPDLTRLTGELAAAIAAARAAVDATDGIGTIASYATEVPLPATGTCKNPGVGSARADIVLTAPEAGAPLLFIEADNCFEDAALIPAVRQISALLSPHGEGHRRHRQADVAHPMDHAGPLRGRTLPPAGPAGLPPDRRTPHSGADEQDRRPHPPALAGLVATASTPTTTRSRSWRPRWNGYASAARPGLPVLALRPQRPPSPDRRDRHPTP
jgi:transposase-like protein